MGSAPFLGGGFGHFYAYAPTKIEYAIDRFAMEVKRQLDVLDRRWPRASTWRATTTPSPTWRSGPGTAAGQGLQYGAGEFLQVQDYKNVQRWTDEIGQRPAVKRGRMVNRTWGEPASQLHERHDAGDFDTKTQDKLERAGGRIARPLLRALRGRPRVVDRGGTRATRTQGAALLSAAPARGLAKRLVHRPFFGQSD
jgi:GST-like protein